MVFYSDGNDNRIPITLTLITTTINNFISNMSTETDNSGELCSQEFVLTSLPCFIIPGTLHLGYNTKYLEYEKSISYFIERAHADESDNPNEKKHVITNVKYKPDNVYNMTDGHAGKCWIVIIYDAEKKTFSNYYIRNWCDLTFHYATNLNLEFVDCRKLSRRDIY